MLCCNDSLPAFSLGKSTLNFIHLYQLFTILVIPLFQHIVVGKGLESQLHDFLAAGTFR